MWLALRLVEKVGYKGEHLASSQAGVSAFMELGWLWIYWRQHGRADAVRAGGGQPDAAVLRDGGAGAGLGAGLRRVVRAGVGVWVPAGGLAVRRGGGGLGGGGVASIL